MTYASARCSLTAMIALLAVALPGAAAGGPIHACRTVTGAHWSYHGKSGSRYLVTELRPGGGPSLCSLARRQIPRLSRMPNGSGPIRLGSTTFACARRRPVGDCLTETGGFRWRPAT